MKKRPKNEIAKDLRTPKYKMRVVPDKKKKKKISKKEVDWLDSASEMIIDEVESHFCVYCLSPRGNHAADCILKGFN